MSVLIVGAGPTGLLMACELARRGIHLRIIDKNPTATASSNATWIQSRTLDIFDHVGIVDRFIDKGNICHGINFYLHGKLLMSIPLNYIASVYPYILMLPQSETEKFLTAELEKFQYQVERPIELINISQDKTQVTAELLHDNGHVETVTSDWLVACDGVNSTVRQKCKVHFLGEDLSDQCIVADAQIESFMSKDQVHVFFDKGTIFAAFPLGKDKYRITANLHLDHPRKFFTEQEVVEMTQERTLGDYYVKNVSWISPFWIHGKMVKNLRRGAIFFAGDAAHVHSPAGGQGMNAGLQDAYNLAWKLALVIQHKAKASLLNSYHLERYAAVEQIVNTTERYTKMALGHKSFLNKLRLLAKAPQARQEVFAKKIAKTLSQLESTYQTSPVIDYQLLRRQSPRQGELAPNVVLYKSTLYKMLDNSEHNVLLFAGKNFKKTDIIEKLLALQSWFDKTYSGIVKAHIVAEEQLSAEHLIMDVEGRIHETYKVKKPCIFIIRPDSYIAYWSENLSSKPVKSFFKKYLK